MTFPENIPKLTLPGKGEPSAKSESHVQPSPKILSRWQMLRVYKTAILWSAFMGLAGINWGLDVLVGKSPEYLGAEG